MDSGDRAETGCGGGYVSTQTYGVVHLFCGLGGFALGMQEAEEEYRGVRGNFVTLAGIDCDPEACADFEMYTGAPAVQMDLFAREDYIAYHGKEPPEGWREVTPEDLRRTTGGIAPDVMCTSAPCKGFSGLLPSKSAKSEKYQALNRLTVRGMKLGLDAWSDDLPGIILFENVPRITTRGAELLEEIKALLSAHGYLFHEGYHDCGEIGGLGQRRKRYLLIARLQEKIPAFVYQSSKRRVRSIGEVIGPLPMPGDLAGGIMHKVPRLQWKTWVRLALIPAGGDWRDLEKIAPEQYRLKYIPRGGGPFGVQDWRDPGATVIGNASIKGSNAAAVADPRLTERDNRHPGVYRVVRWDEPGPCVTGTRFGSGAPAVSDPRTGFKSSTQHVIYRVGNWGEPARTITGAIGPNNGAPVIADPRLSARKNRRSNSHTVRLWDGPAYTITGEDTVGSGAQSISDPRLCCECRNGTMGVQAWDTPGKTVTGSGDVHSGAAAVADPRIPAETEQGIWIIIAMDGTWHRPLTTWELMALQGFPLYMPDGMPVVLAGKSDARWRERIGNAVPPPAAEAMGRQILRALLVSVVDGFELSLTPIWVQERMAT